MDGGVATIADGQSYVSVTLAVTMPNANYPVVPTADADANVYVSDVTTTSFKLYRTGSTTGSLAVRWLAIGGF